MSERLKDCTKCDGKPFLSRDKIAIWIECNDCHDTSVAWHHNKGIRTEIEAIDLAYESWNEQYR